MYKSVTSETLYPTFSFQLFSFSFSYRPFSIGNWNFVGFFRPLNKMNDIVHIERDMMNILLAEISFIKIKE
jgi:hypothetical protein